MKSSTISHPSRETTVSEIETRLLSAGLVLPERMTAPNAPKLSYVNVKIVGTRAILAGHAPLNPDGTIAGPFGNVGGEVTEAEAYVSA